jgi:hypothetical protein
VRLLKGILYKGRRCPERAFSVLLALKNSNISVPERHDGIGTFWYTI